MLNLFQHLIKSNGYETLKRVQGDKITITTQSPGERGGHSSPQQSWGVFWHILIKKMNKKKRVVPFFVLEPLTPMSLEPFIN
jgi:hypothetical protein